ncbi:MAG: bifunctional folylpolyglutamate synthase/dihydrofolate synthase [Anaerovoracaceae bacterium]
MENENSKDLNILDRIAGFLKFGSKLGLERMNELLSRLGDPQDGLRVIHVAGTNGKGSVSRFIYEMLRSAGYRAGLFTSPYLECFNERIELDGALISDEDLEKYGNIVCDEADRMAAEGFDQPTEFEVITAVAFLYFKEKNCSIAVLEVGLGGRGDSTNVVKEPLCSVITSISFDHMNVLGNTIPEIAGEKAGIIKKGCPVVISTERLDAKKVFVDKARETGSLLVDAYRMEPHINEEKLTGTSFDVSVLGVGYKDMEISMPGRYQVRNAVEALTAVTLLMLSGKIEITEEQIRHGMKNAVQRGRFEVMRSGAEGRADIVLDGAHNEDGAKRLEEAVLAFYGQKRILLVTGVLEDKDVEGVMDHFTGITRDMIVTEPDNPRKMDVESLAALLEKKGCRVTAEKNIRKAVGLALGREKGFDLILFAGSLYMIGAARTCLAEQT